MMITQLGVDVHVVRRQCVPVLAVLDAFYHAVRHSCTAIVDGLRNGFEVGRVDTTCGSAEMVEGQAFGNRPIRQLVGVTVGHDLGYWLAEKSAAYVEVAVAGAIACTQPKPAGIWAVAAINQVPKAFSRVANRVSTILANRIDLHREFILSGVTEPDVSASRLPSILLERGQ